MSFGYSVGDVLAVGQLAWKIYKVCKDAPESFKNISQEVLSLHVVLKELEEIYSDANFSTTQQSRLRVFGDGCRAVLEDLRGLVDKYNSLGTSTKRTWDRLAWGSEDIAELRSRLISNTGLLTAFINASQVTVQKKLDTFLQEFRDGKREGSVISTQTVDSLSMDDRQVWRAIRKDLEDIGISVTAFDANKDFIMNWLKRAIESEAFEEETAEEDESSSLFLEDDLDQSFENPEPDDTIPYQPSKDVGNDPSLTSSSAGLQALEISSRARIQRRRPPRAVALVNWLFRYNKNLIQATESGDEVEVWQALEKGADINTKNGKGLTPLFLAASTGNEALLRLLLEHGADIHIQDLGSRKATVLSYSKTEAITSILLEHVVNIHASDSDGRSSLRLAAESGRDTLVQLLLKQGAKIDEKDEIGNTALHRAATFGHETVVQLLLDHGANEKDLMGLTALHHAAATGHETAVQLLLNHGADINEKGPQEYAALHLAAKYGHETVVQLLLKSGANIRERGKRGSTALHLAAKSGHKTVVQLLLKSGAYVNEKDESGHTPLRIAMDYRRYNVAGILKDAGGILGIEDRRRRRH
ncbi:hypothetical protein MMC22_006947 [Lobaria immixta]|nr:hypothetical protein [Lobaria immixta]